MTDAARRKHAIIVGIGFAGLECARQLANRQDLLVTVVDRTNHHLFQPLLYQVAIAGIEAPDIAEPARALLRKFPNVRFQMGTVREVDLERKILTVDDRRLRYDYLAVCAGSRTRRLNIPGIEEHALELKRLDEAMTIRDQVLSACEAATRTRDPDRRRALLTFVVVGGGATGVELTGALAELRLHVLPRDYPEIEPHEFRVVLVESNAYPLSSLGEKLGRYAERTLRDTFGVEIICGTRVSGVYRDGVLTDHGQRIPAYTVVWTAGVEGATLPGLPKSGPGGRIETDACLALPNHPEVYIAGDLNGAPAGETGERYPQLAQTAVQQGRTAGRNIIAGLEGRRPRPFHYSDKGEYVTIGRNKGVAKVAGIEITGPLAWVAWLVIHLVLLVGFRNRLMVLTSWVHSYVTYDFAVRVIHRQRAFPDRIAHLEWVTQADAQ